MPRSATGVGAEGGVWASPVVLHGSGGILAVLVVSFVILWTQFWIYPVVYYDLVAMFPIARGNDFCLFG